MASNGMNGTGSVTPVSQTLEGLEGVKIVDSAKPQSPTSPTMNGNGVGFASLGQSTHGTPSHTLSRGLTTGTASTVGGASGSFQVKSGLAQMLKGGVIMDVTNAAEARIAEEAGACAVMALERIPSDIRKEGGVARMSDPAMIKEIIDAVTIPVMAKCRIGHMAEAQILQACGVDFIDESEVLTPADPSLHIAKHQYKTPFVCGCKNLGEALRRISEGAAMIRTKGEAGTGNVIEAVRHQRMVMSDIRRAASMTDEELYHFAKEISAPYHLLKEVARLKKLPVVSFAAGGIATPADAALMMQLGCDGVFVGSAIFKAEKPNVLARAIVEAVTHYQDPQRLAVISTGLGMSMKGESLEKMGSVRTADRGY